MRYNQIIAIIATALSAVALIARAQDAPNILLRNRSFKLTTEASFTYEKSSVQFEVEEIYSNWQRRTFVRVRTISKGETSEQTAENAGLYDTNFYADSHQQPQVIMFGQDWRRTGYKRQAGEFTDKFFHLDLLAARTPDDGSAPLVGPAKFLLHAMENRKKFAPGSGDQESNIYNFRGEGESPRAIYSLVYHANPIKNHPNGVPALLVAYTEQPKSVSIVYKFKSFELLPDEPVYGPSSGWRRGNFVDAGQSVLFDAFALARLTSYGALAKMDASQSSLVSREYRFSFRARVDMRGMGEMLHLAVGYEPAIEVLRVDRQTRTRLVETLVNYRAKRSYNVIKRLDSQHDTLLDEVVQISRDSQVSCLVSAAEVPSAAAEQTGSPFSLGQMLFGSEEFVYLGVARVRGVEARVFEAYDCAWPVWYQQPVDGGRQQEGGELYRALDDQNAKLNIVVYMTHDASGSDLFAGQPLMMEITRVHRYSRWKLSSTRIDLYDFSRELSVVGADDSRLEHFFTLDDSCTAEESHYADMELLMQRDWPMESTQSLDWLRDSVRRNLALMQTLQEKVGLDSSLVYDVSSKLVRSSSVASSGETQEIISVPATLRLMQHTHSEVNLVFLGTARARFEVEHRRMFVVEHFQSCFLAVAHTREDSLVFAYVGESNLCVLYPRGIDTSASFEFNPKNNKGARFYQVKYSARRRQAEDEISVLVRSRSRFSKLQRLALADPSDPNSRPLEVALKSIELHELDEARDPTGDTNKFQGVGLVPVGKLNRLVEPTVGSLSSAELAHFGALVADMSAARCQAACLADFRCESYSICVRNSRLECVVSSVDFRVPGLISELNSLLAKKDVKLNQQFAVKLDTGASVPVKRHPTCELHNKIYKDLFEIIPRKIKANLVNRRLYEVTDHEHCARLCFEKTQQVLRNEVNLLHNISRQVLSHPESEPETINQAFRDLKSAHLNTCFAFMFFDRLDFLKLSESSQRAIESRIVDAKKPVDKNGFCVVGERESQPVESSKLRNRLDVELTRSNFDFGVLYEKLQDTSLVASPMGKDEWKAYKRVSGRIQNDLKATRSTYQTLREFVDEGENISEPVELALSYSQAQSFCARLCFTQVTTLWPACKSFDLVEVKLDAVRRQTNCYFNSITLRDAISRHKTHLITTSLKDQKRVQAEVVRVVHYEPKADLIGESLDVASLLELDEAQLEASDAHVQHAGANSFLLLCLFMVALGVGVLAGVKLVAPRVLRGLNTSGINEELLT